MNGPEMTKNLFTVEKSVVRDRDFRPTYIEVANMNNSGVGRSMKKFFWIFKPRRVEGVRGGHLRGR